MGLFDKKKKKDDGAAVRESRWSPRDSAREGSARGGGAGDERTRNGRDRRLPQPVAAPAPPSLPPPDISSL